MMKICKICLVEKEESFFRKQRNSCKPCEAEKMRLRREDPAYAAKEKAREQSDAGREKGRERQARYRDRNFDPSKPHRKKLYKDLKKKQCTKCDEIKILESFGVDKHSSDGRTHQCLVCRLQNTDNWRKQNPEKVTAYKASEKGKESARKGTAKYRENHPDRIEEYKNSTRGKEVIRKSRKAYYDKNKIVENQKYKDYYRQNHEKELERRREYSKNNPGFDKFHCSLRYTRKLCATPSWVNLQDIKDIYLRCPSGYEVDHIVPLQGKNVSGLHVPWNLQYLTKSDNRKKSNKF